MHAIIEKKWITKNFSVILFFMPEHFSFESKSNPFGFEIRDDKERRVVKIRDGENEYVFALINGKPVASWDARKEMSKEKWHSMMQIAGDHLRRLQ